MVRQVFFLFDLNFLFWNEEKIILEYLVKQDSKMAERHHENQCWIFYIVVG